MPSPIKKPRVECETLQVEVFCNRDRLLVHVVLGLVIVIVIFPHIVKWPSYGPCPCPFTVVCVSVCVGAFFINFRSR